MTQKPNQANQDMIGDVPEDEGSPSLIGEFIWFLKDNKKWWLIPMIVVFVLVGLLVTMSGTPLAPFLYSLL